jgi:hypothetical protein
MPDPGDRQEAARDAANEKAFLFGKVYGAGSGDQLPNAEHCLRHSHRR